MSATPLDPDGSTAPEDLRRRRQRLVQDDLARVAVEMFLDRGFDAVSVDEIAAAAGISARSFFRYFGSKDEVLLRYRRSLRHRLVRQFRERPEEEAPLRALRNAWVSSVTVEPQERVAMRTVASLLAKTTDVGTRVVGESVLDAVLAEELRRRMGASPDDIGPHVLSAAVSVAALVAWNAWCTAEELTDPAEAVGTAIDLLRLC